MAYPPYRGQGTPLPKGTGFDGEWVIENEVFLYRDDLDFPKGSCAGTHRPDGEECDGFEISALAANLDITERALWELNRSKRLVVEFRRVPADLRGFDFAVEYFFQTPDYRSVVQKISRAYIKGTA